MSEPIPERADVRQLRTQAKELLQSLRSGETLAEGVTPSTAKLADAQRLIARKHGFSSWPKLIAEVETPELLKKLALYAGLGDAAALEKLLKSKPILRKRIDAPLFPFDTPTIIMAAGSTHAKKILPVLVRYGADPNVRSNWWAGGFSALDQAKGEAVDLLLELGAKFDVWSASAHGKVEILREFLDTDPSLVNAPGGDGETPLHFAANVAVAELLLDRGADLERRDVDHESTPLQYQINNPKVARLLVDRGAKPDIFTAVVLDDQALLEQVLRENPDAVTARIDQGEFVTRQSDGRHIYEYRLGSGKTPQQVAAERGNVKMLQLLQKDSPPTRRLASAAWLGNVEEVRKILEEHPGIGKDMGPDASVITDAAQAGKAEVVRLLLEAGLDPAARGFSGGTALHAACWYGHLPVVELLADKVPLDTLDDNFGSPPLGWAVHGSQWCRNPTGDYLGVVERLIQAGADPNAKANSSGTSMLDQAGERQDVKEALIRHGARR